MNKILGIIRDLIGFTGLGFAWYGIQMVSVPLAYTVAGFILMAVAYKSTGNA